MYINPYEKFETHDRWLKSNFHIHAGTGKDTCGALEIDEVIQFYKLAGYDVLTISNHDLYSDVKDLMEKHDLLLINGFEYSQDKHMLCIGGSGLIVDTHQNAIDECNNQGGLVILCHPNWQYKEYWPWHDIDSLHGYIGIEIMNTVIFRLNGTGLATDTWDYLLSQNKLVWGFGSDDFHRWFDLSKCWNMISSDRNQNRVFEALRNGSFYVSTGLILNDFSYKDGKIHITACSKDNYVKSYNYIFIGKNGKILKEQVGEYGEYLLDGTESYIRVQVISEHGAMLWTQPIYDDSLFVHP